jgi:hypothetical protein
VPTIETERLTKFYGGHRGVEEVTIAVESGIDPLSFLGVTAAAALLATAGAALFERRDLFPG